MKKSYYLRTLEILGASGGVVRAAAEAAEAAGVVWDPEAGPAQGQAPAPEPVRLPERLAVWPGGHVGPNGRPWLSAEERERGVAEAVRRYNDWESVSGGEEYWHDKWEEVRDNLGAEVDAAMARAEKAEAEVQRLGGVIDEYCRDLQESGVEVERHRRARRLLTAERDALKLAVQEGEAEVRRLLANLRVEIDGREKRDREIQRLRRRVALIQGFFSEDKEQFKESLRAILREREQEDGDEK